VILSELNLTISRHRRLLRVTSSLCLRLTEVWTAVEVRVQWDLLADHADALAGLIAETTISLTP
jgi:hypothetical protein